MNWTGTERTHYFAERSDCACSEQLIGASLNEPHTSGTMLSGTECAPLTHHTCTPLSAFIGPGEGLKCVLRTINCMSEVSLHRGN